MKISKIFYLLLFTTLTVFTSCEDDELFPSLGNGEPKSITEVISSNSDLSVLLGALQQVKLDSVLKVSSTHTVFAPNNSAFANVDISSLTDEELENTLLNHVMSVTVPGFSSSFATGYTTTMATGPDGNNLSFYTDLTSEARFNGVASLVDNAYDLGATNGVVHTVNGVLTPPTVVDHILANPNYSTLGTAIELAGLTDALKNSDVENGASLFTIFAPNNTAFEALMAQLSGAFGWTSLSDVPTDILQQILMYHVVTDANTLSIEVDGELTTMQGDTFSVSGTVIDDASYTNAGIVLTDIQGVNGIVHGIDKVLLPNEVFQSLLSATLNIVERCNDRGYTTFLAAAEKAGLTNSLTNDELTAFAPSNDAFILFFLGIENYGSLDDFTTDDDKAILKSLLEYHLYSGTLMESGLTDGSSITTVYGDNFSIDNSGDQPKIVSSFSEAQKATIELSNIGATNGIIHQINRVLIPNDLTQSLGVAGAPGLEPVADDALVYFDFNGTGYDAWWGDMADVTDAATSADGTTYKDFTGVQGGSWNAMFFRNAGDNFPGATIGTNLNQYELKFDINVKEPITDGVLKFRFGGSTAAGDDVFYDWDITQIEQSGWITVSIPLTLLENIVPDFSTVTGEFGVSYSGTSMLNFSMDNLRFEKAEGGLQPVADNALVYFDFNGTGYDAWWGDMADVTDAATSADGTTYKDFTGVQGGSWNAMFFRNAGDNFPGATIGTNLNQYALKFDINVKEPITDGVLKFRFGGSTAAGDDVFYDWDITQIEESGWITVSIPLTLLQSVVPDFSTVTGEFGVSYSGTSMLNFSMDNLRFEEL